MGRSSLAHERQSIIQAARIAELERELDDVRANGGPDGGPVASEPAANSDARAPAAQKGRWWTAR